MKIFGTIDPFIEPGPPIGRRVANAGFIRALLRYSDFDEFHLFLPSNFPIQKLSGSLNDSRCKFFSTLDLPQKLGQTNYHCLHCSDPVRAPFLAALRNAHSKTIFPITCTTHSLHEPHYLAQLMAHLWPGCAARDAIVATSQAGKDVVSNYLGTVRERYQLTWPQPDIRVIPLGIDPQPFAPTHQSKALAREKLGIPKKAIVILSFGRISPYSKADLVPAMRALEQADLPRNTYFVVAGYGSKDDPYLSLLQSLAKNIKLKIVTTPSEQQKLDLYHAADIFLAPSDNPQETFGLTLLEAMAAELPVIASDYSGYRDIVVNGETGYLIPACTLCSPSPGLEPLLHPDENAMLIAQSTSVSIPAMVGALSGLTNNPDQRKRMGESGRERVQKIFDWPEIIRQYINLWYELWPHEIDRPLARIHPMSTPYAGVFASHPSGQLEPTAKIELTQLGQDIREGKKQPIIYREVGCFVDKRIFGALLHILQQGVDVSGAISWLASELKITEAHARWCLAWSMKQGIISTSRPPS